MTEQRPRGRSSLPMDWVPATPPLDQFRVVYVDVDLTLILWPDVKPVICRTLKALKDSGAVLNEPLAQALRVWWLAQEERELVIWSANGADHARSAAAWAKVDVMATACLTKPHAFVDDNELWIKKRTWLSPGLAYGLDA